MRDEVGDTLLTLGSHVLPEGTVAYGHLKVAVSAQQSLHDTVGALGSRRGRKRRAALTPVANVGRSTVGDDRVTNRTRPGARADADVAARWPKAGPGCRVTASPKASSALFSDLAMQPRAGEGPDVFGGAFGQTHGGGCFLHRHPHEITQLN